MELALFNNNDIEKMSWKEISNLWNNCILSDNNLSAVIDRMCELQENQALAEYLN